MLIGSKGTQVVRVEATELAYFTYINFIAI